MIPWMQDSTFMRSLENDDVRNNYLDDRFRALKKGPSKSKKGIWAKIREIFKKK